jgi:Rrf2 family protein
MRLSAKTDYALRAVVEMAHIPAGKTITAEQVAERQDIPFRFLQTILPVLNRARIIESRVGRNGGWQLARPADEISLASIIRAVDGPLASVAGTQPQELDYRGTARPFKEVWIAVRSNLRAVLENTTVADVASGDLTDQIQTAVASDDAWAAR